MEEFLLLALSENLLDVDDRVASGCVASAMDWTRSPAMRMKA